MADQLREDDYSKPTATINKAINLLKNKHFVSYIAGLAGYNESLKSLHTFIIQCEKVERHVRAVNRVVTANKNGFVSSCIMI